MKPKFSIITPNYNSFNLMNKFFDSLENQTFKDFEVLIIDDCSTDDSYEKLLEYKKNSKLNLKILKNQKNTGPGLARNIGIDEARGEYLTFMDNDDFIECDLLEKINDLISNNNLDCIIYDYCLDSGKSVSNMSSMYNDANGIVDQKSAIMYTRNHSVCKFYRTRIIQKNKVYYPSLRRHEDIAFVAYALSFCKNIYHLPEASYHYVQREKSLSNKKELGVDTIIEAYKLLQDKMNGNFSKELEEKSVTDLLYGTCIIMCKSKKSRSDIINFINKYEKEYPNWYKSNIISYLGKGKKIFLYAIKHRLILLMKLLAKVHTLLTK